MQVVCVSLRRLPIGGVDDGKVVGPCGREMGWVVADRRVFGCLAVWRFGCWSGFWGLFAVFVVCSGFGLLVFWPFLELLVVY